ncbi:unnamed protein product [Closterium sp. Naga37s-1]|nr:unnamed protein product [Closterium sp. Naga37s-1]
MHGLPRRLCNHVLCPFLSVRPRGANNRNRHRRRVRCDDIVLSILPLPISNAWMPLFSRELKNRGWDPKRGYEENMRILQARGLPPPPQSMLR